MRSTPSPLEDLQDEVVLLPASASTVTAEDLQVRLVLAADHHAAVRVDASQVENVGQAVLQLLVAARTEAEAQGLAFEIVSPSAAFLARVQGCRLEQALGLPAQEEVVL